MRIRQILFTVTLVLLAGSVQAQPLLKLVDPLEPLYPDSNNTQRFDGVHQADFPSGTVADVHLLLAVTPGDSFTLSAVIGGTPLPITSWSRLVDVPVEQNTGLDSRTEAFTNQHNPYVIRRAPFRVYEVLQPLTTTSVASTNRFAVFRLSVPPSLLPTPGTYRIDVSVRGRRWTENGTFIANIHAVRVPPLKEGSFFYTNWYSLVQMEGRHGVVRWSREWFSMLDRYAAMMAHGRQNCIIIPAELIAVSDGRITLDEAKMYSFVEVFRRHGFRNTSSLPISCIAATKMIGGIRN